jgi:hypothetical protein
MRTRLPLSWMFSVRQTEGRCSNCNQFYRGWTLKLPGIVLRLLDKEPPVYRCGHETGVDIFLYNPFQRINRGDMIRIIRLVSPQYASCEVYVGN